MCGSCSIPSPNGGASAEVVVPRLLVVDDEDAVCFAMQDYFSSHGFRVDTATTLDAAVGCMRRRQYAAVVADLRLSDAHDEQGLDLLRRVRAASASLPFLLLAGYPSDDLRAEAERLGVSALLAKPKPPSEIERTVRTLLADR